ncbi:arylsulfatase [Haloferula sp. BvORR071]|uniref:sulfatase family protein n=1 Tax=Haloferula sp. BvORR071 TaxID=1396141 RepID=UPI000558D4C4|nr:arylsulfatase [Haloferula sp. BvORR071]
MLRSALLAIIAISAAHAADKPNIILIYADDLGWGDVSCNGATAVQTPNIDRIAKEGINFNSGYATSSTCTPSRFSLLTGKYAWRQQGTGVLPGDAAMIIDPAKPTLPAMLKKAGYRTGAVGKWHLGLGGKEGVNWNQEIKPSPRELGFDFSHIMAATGDRVPCVFIEDGKVQNLDPADPIEVTYKQGFKGYEGLPNGVKDRASLKMDWSQGHNMAVINGIGRIGYMKGGTKALWNDEEMADHLAGQALRFIRESKDAPFFLYFAMHDIHVPRVPNPRFVGKTSMGPRGDAIVQADWQVGEVLRLLDELKLAENTLLIFTSDNGPVIDDGYKDQAQEKLGTHKPAGPWSGGKYSILEGGTRVPFLVRWPARVKPDQKSSAIVNQIDFAKSFATLTGGDGNFPDSQDVLPALLGESEEGREYNIEHSGQLAIRMANWKFIPAGPKGKVPDRLINLGKDPSESDNLAETFPQKMQELKAKLAEVKGGE